MQLERIRELVALHAVGALDGDDAREFDQLMELRARLESELAAFTKVAGRIAAALPVGDGPSSAVKASLMQRIGEGRKPAPEDMIANLAPALRDGFSFLKNTGEGGWMPLPVPGAHVKLLSFDKARNIAVVMGKLDPGARYPAHKHGSAEDVFVLAGDLSIGPEKLNAGDFHHAAAGTAHSINYSEQGCTILAVISAQDLLAQMAAAST